ncbi:MAG: methionyl-tRNA formyltransferase, partial [Alphaproteobacteria bacterium]|nr:methionyl-tRNA formyltransferase [Alphaproteobacteria bacterium]
RIRAFHPLAWCERDGQRLRVLAARAETASGAPGAALDDGLLIACGSGAARLTVVQPAGKPAMAGGAYLRGNPLPAGSRLD